MGVFIGIIEDDGQVRDAWHGVNELKGAINELESTVRSIRTAVQQAEDDDPNIDIGERCRHRRQSIRSAELQGHRATQPFPMMTDARIKAVVEQAKFHSLTPGGQRNHSYPR